MYEWLLAQSGFLLYAALFFSLVGGAVGLPIPEDLPLIAAGIAVERGVGRLELVFFVCYFAIIIGDLIIFLIGRRFGPALFNKKWFRSRIPPSRIKKMRLSLERRSLLMIFVARHLFYLRTVTFLACGAVKMKISRFIIADAAAALISVPIMLFIGYKASEHYDTVIGILKNVELGALVVILAFVGYYLYKRYRKKKELAVTEPDTTK